MAGERFSVIEVDAGRAAGQQVRALQRRVGDAELGDGLVVAAAGVELAHQAGGSLAADSSVMRLIRRRRGSA